VRRPLLAIAVVTAALSLAPSAFGADEVASRELVRTGGGAFVLRGPVARFTLAGVHWQGSGGVEFRTRSTDGRWSPWRAAAPESEDGPDAVTRERRVRGWRLGNPWWVDASDAIEARGVGDVERVKVHLIRSPALRVALRSPAATVTPTVVPRAAWGADEKIRRAPPSYAPSVRFSIVHHTAGTNGYSRAEAPAIVRGIQLFHVRSNGWNDIGYNFLVDRFGTIYEGRFGGIDRNVIGAHALGFNTGSVGIALIGTYGSTAPSAAAQDAIARLIAWRLDLAHVDPTTTVSFVSGGSDLHDADVAVRLRAVSGHRDTGRTSCPGDTLYGRLGAIGTSARAIGGVKIFEPRAEVTGSLVRVRARVSSTQPWVVQITGPGGAEVARSGGTGTVVDWTWESAGAAAGSYRWTVTAGAARPATGVLRAGGSPATLAIESLDTDRSAISPNGDGQADTAAVRYRLSAPANVTVEVTDALGGVAATVVDRVWTRAGESTVTVDGAALLDGSYSVVVTARTASGAEAQRVIPLAVNRALGLVAVTPSLFSPNADGRKDGLVVSFTLAAPAEVRIRIEREGRWVATPLAGSFLAGLQRFTWDGTRAAGPLRDGAYEVVVEAASEVGVISFGLPFASDTVAPSVRVLPGRGVRIAVSEASMLTLVIDGRGLKRQVREAGIVRIPWPDPTRRVRVVAWDAAGNVSAPAVRVTRS
jgi:uncharacterized protein with LGFP repeats